MGDNPTLDPIVAAQLQSMAEGAMQHFAIPESWNALDHMDWGLISDMQGAFNSFAAGADFIPINDLKVDFAAKLDLKQFEKIPERWRGNFELVVGTGMRTNWFHGDVKVSTPSVLGGKVNFVYNVVSGKFEAKVTDPNNKHLSVAALYDPKSGVMGLKWTTSYSAAKKLGLKNAFVDVGGKVSFITEFFSPTAYYTQVAAPLLENGFGQWLPELGNHFQQDGQLVAALLAERAKEMAVLGQTIDPVTLLLHWESERSNALYPDQAGNGKSNYTLKAPPRSGGYRGGENPLGQSSESVRTDFDLDNDGKVDFVRWKTSYNDGFGALLPGQVQVVYMTPTGGVIDKYSYRGTTDFEGHIGHDNPAAFDVFGGSHYDIPVAGEADFNQMILDLEQRARNAMLRYMGLDEGEEPEFERSPSVSDITANLSENGSDGANLPDDHVDDNGFFHSYGSETYTLIDGNVVEVWKFVTDPDGNPFSHEKQTVTFLADGTSDPSVEVIYFDATTGEAIVDSVHSQRNEDGTVSQVQQQGHWYKDENGVWNISVTAKDLSGNDGSEFSVDAAVSSAGSENPFINTTGLHYSAGSDVPDDFMAPSSVWFQADMNAIFLSEIAKIVQAVSLSNFTETYGDNPVLLEMLEADPSSVNMVVGNGELKGFTYSDSEGSTQKIAITRYSENGVVYETSTLQGANGVDLQVIRNTETGEYSYEPTIGGTGISIGALASVFGSTLGRQLGGNDPLLQISTGTVLGVVADNFAEAVSLSISSGDIENSVDLALEDFGLNLKQAGVGAVSSFLTAELIDVLGIGGVGAEITNIIGGQLVGNLAQNIVFNDSFATGLNPAALAGAFGSFLGGKLAGAIISFDTLEGQIGSSIGSAAGALVAGKLLADAFGSLGNFVAPGIGAFVGAILGGVIGNMFAGTAESGVHVYWDEASGEFKALADGSTQDGYSNWHDDGGSSEAARGMAESAADIFNNVLRVFTSEGGELLNGGVVTGASWGQHGVDSGNPTWRYWLKGENSHDSKGVDDEQENFAKTTSFAEALGSGIGYNLSRMAIIGGDLFARRAFYANTGQFSLSSAKEYEASSIIGDLAVAADYAAYLENAALINFMIASEPYSAFSVGWIVTLQRASELGLDQFQKSDLFGGLQSLVPFLTDVSMNDVRLEFTDSDGDGKKDLLLHIAGNSEPTVISNFANTMGYSDRTGLSGTTMSDIMVATGDTAVNYTDSTGTNALESEGVLNGDGKSRLSDDIFVGGGGNDTLSGGRGWDWLDGNAGDDKITGGVGRDVLLGRDGADMLSGGTGNDTLADGAGADTVRGGTGDDVILVAQDSDADVLDGQGGRDTASYEDWSMAIDVTLSGTVAGDSFSSIENITGTNLSDTITGDSGENLLVGGAGDDVLSGGAGEDTLEGGAGEDTLEGGSGADTASYAGSRGGVYVDLADNSKNDQGDAKGDVIAGVENLSGSDYGDTLKGNGSSNLVSGAGGDDVLQASGGSDTLDGGAGFDIVDYSAGTGAVTVNLQTGTGTAGMASGQQYINIEGVRGTSTGDTLIGLDSGSWFDGDGGNDQIIGGEGSDVYLLTTDGGTDTVTTGGGQDVFLLDSGIDFRDLSVSHATGEYGVQISAGSGTLAIEGGAGFASNIAVIQNADGLSLNVESVQRIRNLGAGDNTLELTHDLSSWINAGAGDDAVITGAGNDILLGGSGNDTLFGGLRNDTYIYRVGDGSDIIEDDGGTDTLIIEGDVALEDLSFNWIENHPVHGRVMEMTIGDGSSDSIIFSGWTDRQEIGRIETLIIDGQAVDLTEHVRELVENTAPTGGSGNVITLYNTFQALPGGTSIGPVFGSDADGDRMTYKIVGVTNPINGVNFWIENGSIKTDLQNLTGHEHMVTLSVVASDGMATSTPFDVDIRIEHNPNTVHGNLYKYPVVFDLDGDGVELISMHEASVTFDMDQSGDAQYTGWFGPDDGVLALDINGNGIIDDGGEISFSQYVGSDATDIEGLKHFDTNNDNKLNSNDDGFGDFLVWRDENTDGISQEGELYTLEELGITEISLDITPTYDDITLRQDNTITGYVNYTMNGDDTRVAGDVAFFYWTDPERGIEIRMSGEGGPAIGTSRNDTIHGSANDDFIKGNEGDDLLYGNGGEDIIIADKSTGDIGQDTVHGGEGQDWISAVSGNDVIYGDEGADYILAFEGADTVYGGNGSDVIEGDEGHFYGEDGDDVLNGGYYMYGGNGDDTLISDGDVAQLWGDAGSDLFRWRDVGAVRTVTINDFEFGVDKIDISEANVRYEDLSFSGDKITADYIDRNGRTAVLSIRLRDSSGILPDESAFIIDVKAPTILVEPQYYQGQSPTLVGTVQDVNDVKVYVTVAGRLYETDADAYGNWAITIEDTLDDGTYDVSIRAEDKYGNSTEASFNGLLTLANTAPIVTIDTLHTSDRTPLLTGTTDSPDALVEVKVDNVMYVAETSEDGTWSLQLSEELPEGFYDVGVVTTDRAGNVASVEGTSALHIDHSAPTGTQTYLETGDATPTLTGTIDDPTAAVTVTISAAWSPLKQSYEATNLGDGTWELTVPDALQHGDYDINVRFTDGAGNTSIASNIVPEYHVLDSDLHQLSSQIETQRYTNIAFGDLDGDGLTDMISNTLHNEEGYTWYHNEEGYRFRHRAYLPLGEGDLSPAIFDLDGDGDMDIIFGDTAGRINWIENQQEEGGDVSWGPEQFLNIDIGNQSRIAHGDLDGDGDIDLIGSNTDGNIVLIRNDGTAQSPDFVLVNDASSPTQDLVFSNRRAPELIDIDADGDLDLFLNDHNRIITFLRNDGDATNPVFIEVPESENPLNWLEITARGMGIEFGDIDNDGDLDLVVEASSIGSEAPTPVYESETIGLSVRIHGPSVSLDTLTTNDTTPTLTGTVSDPAATVTVTIGAESNDAVNNGDGTWSLEWPTVLADGNYSVGVAAADVFGNTTVRQTGVAQFTQTLNEGDQPIVLGPSVGPHHNQVALVDIDGDGDLDIFAGRSGNSGQDKGLIFYRNDGTATAPNFVEVTGAENPLHGFLYPDTTPAFADFDGDGDQDLVISGGSRLSGLENIGTATAPVFVQQEQNHAWIGATMSWPLPVFVDIDGDGDLDAYVHERRSTADLSHFQLNIGSVTDPVFVEMAGTPAADLIDENGTVAAFFDYDGDGDLDAFSIDGSDIILHENIGSIDAPQFVLADDSKNPFAGIDRVATIAFGDINGDGIVDAVAGSDDVFIYWGQAQAGADLTIDTVTAAGTVNQVVTTDNTPLLSGTISDPEASIEVEIGGIRYAVENPGDGTWQIKLPNAIGDGVHDVTLHTVDPWGNVAARTFAGMLAISGNPPLVTLDTPDPQTRTPLLTGTVDDAAATIVVKIDGVAHDAINHGDGTWSYQVTTPLADGRYDIGVVGTDADGATGRSQSPIVSMTRNSDIFSDVLHSSYAMPAFADLDADGDLDALFTDNAAGELSYLRNDGGSYTQVTGASNPFDGISHNGIEPALADLDGDGDQDLVIGTGVAAELLTYWNEGTLSAPSFVRAAAETDPFTGLAGLEDRGWSPTFVDIDADGDLDLIAGESYGTIRLFENTGTQTTPSFVQVTGAANPFDGLNFGRHSSVAFADIDQDGDYDFVVGASTDNDEIRFYLNQGTAEEADFIAATGEDNPYADEDYLPNITPRYVAPTFADTDGDGDDDLVFGYNKRLVGGFVHVIETETDELVIDSSAPKVTFEDFETSDSTPVLSGTVDDPNATIVVTVGDATFGAVNNGDGTWAAHIDQALEVGAHTVQAAATNWAGNTGYSVPNYTVNEITGPEALFDGVDVGTQSVPTLTDIDGDGDLDVFVGNSSDTVTFFRNEGTAEAPSYVEVTGADNPLDGINPDRWLKPSFIDFDQDGDLDLVIGGEDGTYYYRNDGSATAAVYTELTGNDNPFRYVSGMRGSVTFGDLDNDGDQDVLYGIHDVGVQYLQNSGGILDSRRTTLSGIDIRSRPTVALYDIDGDGDLDLLVGEYNKKVNYFRNDGTVDAPVFTLVHRWTENPLWTVRGWNNMDPAVADVNADGIPDVLIGHYEGEVATFLGVADGDDLVITAANTLEGVAGDDTLTGTAESDIFTYSAGWGNDVAQAFTPGVDMIDLSATSLQYADLAITDNGGNTLISEAGGNSITLTGVAVVDIGESDFSFSAVQAKQEIDAPEAADTLFAGVSQLTVIDGLPASSALNDLFSANDAAAIATEVRALTQFTQAMASFGADTSGIMLEERWSVGDRPGVPQLFTVSGAM